MRKRKMGSRQRGGKVKEGKERGGSRGKRRRGEGGKSYIYKNHSTATEMSRSY